MKDQNKWTYYGLIMGLGVIIYFVFPPIFNSAVLTMGLLLFINPIYNIVSCMLYTVKFGIQVYLPISLALLFLLSMILFYGTPFMYYCIFYAAAAFVGCGMGYPIYKRYL